MLALPWTNVRPPEDLDVSKTIIVTGRGGTGKTTFAVLAARVLPSPKLMIDADPDQCLGVMLGVDLAENGVHTVSEALYEIQEGRVDQELKAMPLAQKVEYLLNLSCLYESSEFDLLTLGVKWTRGCYCAPNDILRGLIPRIVDNYELAIFDSPAGLEHLNRRVLTEADDVFAVVDPSAKALRNVKVVQEMAGSIGIRFENLYLVANHRFPEQQLDRLNEIEGAVYLGQIAPDPAVEEADWEGRSFLDLPPDSPACLSVAGILRRAGYQPAQ